jgi:hypothetical protein
MAAAEPIAATRGGRQRSGPAYLGSGTALSLRFAAKTPTGLAENITGQHALVIAVGRAF